MNEFTMNETPSTSLRVLVCGGRHYSDQSRVWDVLDRIHARTPIKVLIHGAANGADILAGRWVNRQPFRDIAHLIDVIAIPANWAAYRRSAGPRRNTVLLSHRPDLVVAFPGGTGTSDMTSKAQRAGIPILWVLESGTETTDGNERQRVSRQSIERQLHQQRSQSEQSRSQQKRIDLQRGIEWDDPQGFDTGFNQE